MGRAFAFVLLAAAAVTADSDPYTIGQVASGLTRGGVITGVDYSNGFVSGYGAIGNRRVAYANHAYSAPVAASYAVSAPVAAMSLLLILLTLMLPLPTLLMEDMDTTMASVRLKLMLMLTPLDKLMLDSQLSMLMLLDIPTMLESLLPLSLPLLQSLL